MKNQSGNFWSFSRFGCWCFFHNNKLTDIKVGIILGFTGPIESLTPDMASGAELAFKEATDSEELLGGAKFIPLRADSTCRLCNCNYSS